MKQALRAAEHVLTFHPMDRVPVFHRHGSIDGPGYERQSFELARGFEACWSEWRTPCGLLISQHLWVEHGDSRGRPSTVHEHDRHPTWMRADNALRIGRLCRRCFPVGVG